MNLEHRKNMANKRIAHALEKHSAHLMNIYATYRGDESIRLDIRLEMNKIDEILEDLGNERN